MTDHSDVRVVSVGAVNRVAVANAALLEVGLEPVAAEVIDQFGAPTLVYKGLRNPLSRKASLLATIAVLGPHALVRCDACLSWSRPKCTPVRDALMGRRCDAVTSQSETP